MSIKSVKIWIMMNDTRPCFIPLRKGLLPLLLLVLLAACSTNPATGERQFTALMSPAKEIQVGAAEHQKIKAQFGLYEDKALNAYVNAIGQKVVRDTERPDITYQFFILDTPMVNAFAVPGGYIYLSRGLLALAGNEAEMAAVLAHEAAHITARHSAERYSRGVVSSLGTTILSAVIDQAGVSKALGLGSELYMKSYSRGQENEADMLGIRYLSQAGYDPGAMSSFLKRLQADAALEAKKTGENQEPISYFSTHPTTADRVVHTHQHAENYKAGGVMNKNAYLQKIKGLVYGDSAAQGFIRGQKFIHPEMGFSFEAPAGFRLINQPSRIIATSKTGAVILFDMAGAPQGTSPQRFIQDYWLKGERETQIEALKVSSMKAATTFFPAEIKGKSSTVRLVAIEWAPGRFARFQMAIPQSASTDLVGELKRATHSFYRLSKAEKQKAKPYKIRITAAAPGDTVQKLSQKMGIEQLREETFRVLNGLGQQEGLKAGELYKVIH